MVNSVKKNLAKIKNSLVEDLVNPLVVRNKRKIFCIGHNKTGTTSIQQACEDFGYLVGNQAKAELLIHDYKTRNFRSILSYCKTAQVFQDIPFSLPFLFVSLDQHFRGSKFILTVRDSAEQWYESLVRFQSIRFGNGSVPNKTDLQNSNYRYKGFSYEIKKIIYGTDDLDLYNKDKMIALYNNHNAAVKEYFRYRPDDLLVINLSDKNSYYAFCKFIDREPLYTFFPWLNKSKHN